jgi:hypothetical protein
MKKKLGRPAIYTPEEKLEKKREYAHVLLFVASYFRR